MLHCDTKVGSDFWKKVGSSKNKIRLSSKERVGALEGVSGAVSFINILNDTNNNIKHIAIDEKLQKETYWNFHPQSNTHMIEMS